MAKIIKKSSVWEQGSDFHWIPYKKNPTKTAPWADTCVWGGSGRDLFQLLLKYGMQVHGWRRLWIPAYFCNDVTRSILTTGIDVAVYPYGPQDTACSLGCIDFLPHDVLLMVNFFGISKRMEYRDIQRKVTAIIEDHTHDPWSTWSSTSNADWCIASLRKVLPLPDGGVLWSPRNHPLPSAVRLTNERRDASLQRLAGMFLKSLYVNRHDLEKDVFRNLLTAGELGIASGPISGMSEWASNMLTTFPIDLWREKRRNNHRVICNELSHLSWLSILGEDDTEGSCPFSAVLIFDTTARRDFVYKALIQSRIYPAILWPLERPAIDGTPERYVDLSRRILSIHCDMRYNDHDMIYVGKQIRKLGGQYIDAQL